MYLCYMDESGTSSIPGNTSHFVLVGLSIPIWHWKDCDQEIAKIKNKYLLSAEEIHTAWILRKYLEQNQIPSFDKLAHSERRSEVDRARKGELLRLQRNKNPKLYRQVKKNYIKTEAYIHLTIEQRKQFIKEIAACVANWGFARLFAECVDKVHFDQRKTRKSIDEQTFEQVISRFEQYLQIMDSTTPSTKNYGLLIHDNNDTVLKNTLC